MCFCGWDRAHDDVSPALAVRLHPQELDEQLYEECKRQFEQGRQQEQQRLETMERKWHALQLVASQRAPK